MSEAPLLSRRRLEDESPMASSHNLMDRHGREEEYEEEPTEYGSGVYRYPPYLQPGHFTSLEKLMFFSSSILLILLFIFAGLYARSSQQDNHVPSLPTIIPEIPKNHSKKQEVCLEPNCIVTAAHILQDVDQELNPCDDFYDYTCSKWISNHLIPDVKSRIDVFTGTKHTIQRRLDQILNREFISKEEQGMLPNPNNILERQLFTKVQDLYKSCMDQDTIEKKNITPLYELFRKIREFIPINNEINQIGLNDAIQYLGEINVWPLFEIIIKPDIINNSNKGILSLMKGQVGLPNIESYNNPEIMKVYMEVVNDILSSIFKLDLNNEFGWKSWSTIATARRIVEFEKKLVELLSLKQDEKEEGEFIRWELNELNEKIPEINWNKFISKLIEPPKYILIPNSKFINNLSKEIILNTNSRTIQIYFIWRTIWKYLNVLGEEFIEPKRRLNSKLIGIEARAKPERWETCINLIEESEFGLILERYFILNDEKKILNSKKQIELLSKSIKNILNNRLPLLNWINNETTRIEIKEKLNLIQFQIAYSNSNNPNILSIISISEYFNNISIEKNNLFNNLIKLNRNQVKQQFLMNNKEENNWKLNPQSITKIYYNKELNNIIIASGLLQLPFIDSIIPPYFYYGTIGWMIGHEIMHAFDKNGRKYNSKGLFGNWWDEITENNFNQENQCLISQYNNFGINGEITLNNNLADNLGLNVFESLLINQTNDTKIIPGLNDWTKDQLAYIQFARMKCSKSTKEHKLLVKDYSPDKFRVNGPLMNSNHFSKTFNCKVGSYMNPEIKKCQVW